MPSAITHELIAKSAQALLPREARAVPNAAPDYYYLGAQGPDLMFFYKPLSREYNFGKLLHRQRLYEWFNALLSALRTRAGEEKEKCLAYALGFCTHLEADAAFHPFVYAYMREHGLKKKEHQRIENDWDVHFAQTLEEKSARGYRFPFDLKKIAREGVLYRYIRDAAASMGREIEKGGFRRALKIYRWYLVHFHRRRGRYLMPFLSHLYPRKVPDRSVLGGETFAAIAKEENADALFLRAAERSAERMREFLSAAADGSALSSAFSRHLLTGETAE